MTQPRLCFAMSAALSDCLFVGGEKSEWTQTLATQQASFSFEGSSVVIAASYRNDSNHDVRGNPCGDGELLLLQK